MIGTGHRLIGIALLVIAIVLGAASYTFLPDSMPVHWNEHGEVDGWMETSKALLMLPGVMLATFLTFQVIGVISPKGFRLDRFADIVGLLQNAILGFLLLIFAAQLAAGLGWPDVMDMTVLAGTGLLFIVLGNFLGKTRKNFFIGIRTPWTLASDEVWLKTHRLAGWLFVVAGILLLVMTPFRANAFMIVAVAMLAGFVPVFYSLYLYYRLEGFRANGADEDA